MSSDDDGGLFGYRPILSVDSVAQSLAYYVNTLGFHVGWSWSDADQRFLRPGDHGVPTFALVGRGGVRLMLAEKCQGVPGMWLHLDVHMREQVDALYDSWARNGARIIEPPSCRPWGMYEMRVQDLDGHTFRVSAPVRKSAEPCAPPNGGPAAPAGQTGVSGGPPSVSRAFGGISTSRMQHFDVYDLIARIRPRPAMYVGSHSLVRLRSFLDGCFFMAGEYNIECCARPSFGGFHDWVARRFGWYESTAGWCNIIVQECGGDESKALDRFFELVDEYCHPT